MRWGREQEGEQESESTAPHPQPPGKTVTQHQIAASPVGAPATQHFSHTRSSRAGPLSQHLISFLSLSLEPVGVSNVLLELNLHEECVQTLRAEFPPQTERTLSRARSIDSTGQPRRPPLSPGLAAIPTGQPPRSRQLTAQRSLACFCTFYTRILTMSSLGLKPTALLASERPEWPFPPPAPGRSEQS